MELLIRLIVLATVLAGCYSPSLDGKFDCAADRSCPSGLRCASDGVCRDDSSIDDAGRVIADLAMTRATDASSGPDASSAPDASMSCQKKSCTGQTCGDLFDGCGGTLSCGACSGPMRMCGAAGANQCGNGFCLPRSCKSQNADCGQVSDNCAALLDCGDCKGNKSCGADHKCH